MGKFSKYDFDPVHDYYRFLGVSPTASEEEIRLAYRKLAKTLHPDSNPDRKEWADQQFKQLNNIKEVLLDPELRAEYDRQRKAYILHLFGAPDPVWRPPPTHWEPPPEPDEEPLPRPRVKFEPRPSKLYANVFILVGLALIFAGIWFGITTMLDALESPSLSSPITIDQIGAMKSLPPAASVKLSGLDCASLKDDGNKTQGLLPSTDRHTLAVISFSEIRTCPDAESASIAGSVQPLDGGEYNFMVAHGAFANYPKATTFIGICENCGGSDPLATAGLTLMICGMGFYALWMGMSKLASARQYDRRRA